MVVAFWEWVGPVVTVVVEPGPEADPVVVAVTGPG